MYIIYETKQKRPLCLNDLHHGFPACLAIYASTEAAEREARAMRTVKQLECTVRDLWDWAKEAGVASAVPAGK